jgi:hypothetical protein
LAPDSIIALIQANSAVLSTGGFLGVIFEGLIVGTMLMSIATNIAVITAQPQIQNKTEQQQRMEQQFLIAKARIVKAQRQKSTGTTTAIRKPVTVLGREINN